MVLVREVYTRCGHPAPDVHHLLFRSRGGELLDEVGETYHLINLCRRHHDWVHKQQGRAMEAGMVITGYVVTQANGLKYVGPDPYLSERYP
jgi:hypothetical protein